MGNFRSLWYKLKKKLFSIKALLFFTLVYLLYREFEQESTNHNEGIAKVPHHRNEHQSKKQLKKAKKAKKEKKHAKQQQQQERFENMEDLVENNENHRLEGEIAVYSDDDVADGNVFNQEIFEKSEMNSNSEELNAFKMEIGAELAKANVEDDISPDEFRESSELALENFEGSGVDVVQPVIDLPNQKPDHDNSKKTRKYPIRSTRYGSKSTTGS